MAIVGLSVVSCHWFSPSLAEAATPGWWILEIFLRNLVILTLLSQGLHIVFHSQGWQGTDKKYNPRPFPRKGRMFDFGDQYWENVFWSLASGVTIWTAYEALVLCT